jgi:hypothetical protein
LVWCLSDSGHLQNEFGKDGKMDDSVMTTQEMNAIYEERYGLMKERVQQLAKDASSCGLYADYVGNAASFLTLVYEVYERILADTREQIALQQWQDWNERLYEDIKPKHYEFSYANPDVSTKAFGKEMGQRLCFLYTELRSLIPSAYEGNLSDLVIFSELFVEIVTILENDAPTEAVFAVQDAIYQFERDYSEVIVTKRVRSQLDADMDFAAKIVCESDLDDDCYLYYYGEYVGANEIKSAHFLNTLPQSEIDAMAFTYTDGYREGFAIAGIDLTAKKTVNIRYHIGFERMVKVAIKQFLELGLRPCIYPAATKSLDKNRNLKIGYCGTPVNKQYDYDHRFDNALYLDKAFVKRRLEVLKQAYDECAVLCREYAGPAVIEVFGEEEFTPRNKDSAICMSESQQQLNVMLTDKSAQLVNQYIPHDQYSFTIIAYPLPEIGDDYPEIFAETVRVNTLDKERYKQIQQTLIDALDQAEYVHVKGAEGNQTDMKVMLHDKDNPQTETNFENCLADVNIPVGEVFTSPKLAGTCGTLHVSSAYLNDLDYKNLTLSFEDGRIVDYMCSNFETDEENKTFIKENLLNHRDTLPLGEFAIGTNTTAYVMARRYDILHKLPILIVEKTGPHFAVGDTCYSHSEQVRLYNPDGKEIVAKENECSLLRFTDEDKAYFNIHTDITIPYEEIGVIEAVLPDGETIALLQDGRFVLAGTEELNLPQM